MNCSNFQNLIPELVDGLTAPADAEGARTHAGDCAECAERLAASQRFTRLLAGPGDEAINAWNAHLTSVNAAAAAVVAERAGVPVDPSVVPVRPAPIRRMFPYAAIVAASVIVAATAASFLRGPEVLAEDRPTALTRGMHVLASEGRELEAEDAAQVVVPRGSEGAVVRLDEGNVLFRVAPGHIFAVETPQGTATALGTSFHVAVTGSRQVSVAVHSGSVRFVNDRETTLLGMGDRLEIDASGVQRLINRRRLDDLQTDLTATRETAARLRREQDSHPGAGPVPSAAEPVQAPVGDAVRTYFESDEGKRFLATAIKAVQDEAMAQGAARMFDGMVSRFAKDADLTEDQAKKLRDVFRRSGAEFRDAWAPLSSIPSEASEVERDRIRHEVAEESAEIERKKDDEVRLLLSQTQYEKYQKQFAKPKPGFGEGSK